jgi:menaquinol-cytochrome c reductase cytochrome b/c subunit
VPVVERGTGPKLPGPPGVPGTERFRLLAYVKQESMVRVDKRPDETVLTWPHLLRAEFLMAALITALLVITSFFIQAPLEEMANAGATPHVAKAPWYFLGLQEMLSYFNATVVGVLFPPIYFIGLMVIAYIDRSPYKAARDRKLAWVFFMCLMVGGLLVTFIGSFFRGPGWNWVWPWQGIFFTL